MKKYHKYILSITAVVCIALIGSFLYKGTIEKNSLRQFSSVSRKPLIKPDYSDICIPPNIAPLNFMVLESGKLYYVKIYSKNGGPVEVFSKSPKIEISAKSWRSLLEKNKGNPLYFEISVKPNSGQWQRFDPVSNLIALEGIDSYLVYRTMHPTHTLYNGPMNICQRDLTTYSEGLILDRDYLGAGSCLNCHSFRGNDPDYMLLGIRTNIYKTNSTLLVHKENVDKIDTKFGYTSWHPSGKLAAYSVDNLPMFYHTAAYEIRDTIDMDSFIAIYDVNSETVTAPPALAKKDLLETWPAWSADGKYLYFCSAPMLWSDKNKVPPDRYKDVKYDIVRISFDVNNGQWGQQETVVSAGQTGLSAAMPKLSPDGRWLSFCMSDYGFFPTWRPSSDLYLIDLQSEKQKDLFVPKKLGINSDQSESWHTWSSNSRWIIFSSKRDYGVFTRLYISFIDMDGNFSKPFILPQKDPLFYDNCLFTFNTPELIDGPVRFTGEQLDRVIRSPQKISVKIPITMATPKPGQPASELYKSRE